MDLKLILLMLSLQLVFGYEYPINGGGRYLTSTARRPSFYRPIPSTSRRIEYPAADYDDSYVPTDQFDLDYFEKYEPYRYGSQSLIPFYRPRTYYYEKPPRKAWDRLTYYDEPIPQEPLGDYVDGMYDDTTWYDDPDNAEANRAFIKNLLMAQLYQDSKFPTSGSRYDFGNEDNNGRKYDYGIPTTKIGETEQVRRYFDENLDNDNDDVKALEALAGKEEKDKEMDEKEVKEKEPTEKPENVNGMTEKPIRAKPKLNDLKEYFDLQKQFLLNGRKSNARPVAESFRLNKKQIYEPGMGKVFEFEPSDESTTNSIKKLNMIKENIMMKEMQPTSTSAAAAVLSTTATPQKLANGGQKEVVLPRPSNTGRKPYPEIATRSMNPPSVYDTIKKLLDMEREAANNHKTRAQPQKRFAVTDDPLTAELNQLKKPSA